MMIFDPPGFLNYPLILREDHPPARLVLLIDLTKAEAERLVKFMESLVVAPRENKGDD